MVEPTSGPEVAALDPIFGKSASNVRSELSAIELLLGDARFQVPDVETKKAILRLLPVSDDCSHRTFDAVMTPDPRPPIDESNLAAHLDGLLLIELKATKKAIRNSALNGFFFGATKREYDLAAALGDRYLFAFVVLSSENDYGRPFFVLLTLEELEKRTRTKRIQYQINLRSDTESVDIDANFGRFDGVITSSDGD
jgi:hypothetical protein